jgi:hypothetical protein
VFGGLQAKYYSRVDKKCRVLEDEAIRIEQGAGAGAAASQPQAQPQPQPQLTMTGEHQEPATRGGCRGGGEAASNRTFQAPRTMGQDRRD